MSCVQVVPFWYIRELVPFIILLVVSTFAFVCFFQCSLWNVYFLTRCFISLPFSILQGFALRQQHISFIISILVLFIVISGNRFPSVHFVVCMIVYFAWSHDFLFLSLLLASLNKVGAMVSKLWNSVETSFINGSNPLWYCFAHFYKTLFIVVFAIVSTANLLYHISSAANLYINRLSV